jgi:hypothetical protein
VAEAERENWREANALFRRAHELSPSARTLRGLGMVAFNLKEYVDAVTNLRVALEDPRRPLTHQQQEHARDLLEQAELYVGEFTLVVTPSDAQVSVDDRPMSRYSQGTLLLDIGSHELKASATGYRDATRKVVVEGGEGERIELVLSREPVASAVPVVPVAVKDSRSVDRREPAPVPRRRIWTWVAFGGAAVFGAGGVFFAVRGNRDYRQLESQCPEPGCLPGEIDSSGVETNHAIANAFFVTSGVLFTGSVALFFLEPRPETEQRSASLRVGPGRVALRGRF